MYNYTLDNYGEDDIFIFFFIPWISFFFCILAYSIRRINYKNKRLNRPTPINSLSDVSKFKNNKKFINDNCVICYDNFEDKKSIILDCEHKYHLDCIDSWFKDYNKNCCPICKEVIC